MTLPRHALPVKTWVMTSLQSWTNLMHRRGHSRSHAVWHLCLHNPWISSKGPKRCWSSLYSSCCWAISFCTSLDSHSSSLRMHSGWRPSAWCHSLAVQYWALLQPLKILDIWSPIRGKPWCVSFVNQIHPSSATSVSCWLRRAADTVMSVISVWKDLTITVHG